MIDRDATPVAGGRSHAPRRGYIAIVRNVADHGMSDGRATGVECDRFDSTLVFGDDARAVVGPRLAMCLSQASTTQEASGARGVPPLPRSGGSSAKTLDPLAPSASCARRAWRWWAQE
jgi:hypothetical protein